MVHLENDELFRYSGSRVIFDSCSWLRTVSVSLSSVFAKEIANWLLNTNIVNLLSAEVKLFFFFKWSLPELSCAIAGKDLMDSVIPDKLSLRARWLIFIINKWTETVAKFQFMREGHLTDLSDFV